MRRLAGAEKALKEAGRPRKVAGGLLARGRPVRGTVATRRSSCRSTSRRLTRPIPIRCAERCSVAATRCRSASARSKASNRTTSSSTWRAVVPSLSATHWSTAATGSSSLSLPPSGVDRLHPPPVAARPL